MPAPSYKNRERQHKIVFLLNAKEKRQLEQLTKRTGLCKAALFRDYIHKQHSKLVASSSNAR